jgi:hypothetical protein
LAIVRYCTCTFKVYALSLHWSRIWHVNILILKWAQRHCSNILMTYNIKYTNL